MKKIFKTFLILFLLVFMFKVNAKEDSMLAKIKSGGTIDVNIVDPVNLTKTFEYFKQKNLEYAEANDFLDDNHIAWANNFYRPEGEMVGEIITPYISSQIKDQNAYIYVYDCNEERDCKVSVTDMYDDFHWGEEHIYNVRFNFIGKYDSKVEDEMIRIYESIQNRMKELEEAGNNSYKFELEDINMIDYLYNLSNYNLSNTFLYSNSINYSEEIRKLIKENYRLFVTLDVGEATPSLNGFGGRLMFGDKNSYYYAAELDGLMRTKYLIYIPENTEDTVDAYIAAATKRVNDYYGKKVVDISYKRTIKETWTAKFCDEITADTEEEREAQYNSCVGEEFDDIFDADYKKYNMFPYIYNVKINGKDYEFLIAKDNSKLAYPTGLESIDYTSNIMIEANSNEIPLDSQIEVEVYDENSSEYQNIIHNHSGFNFFDIFDIRLFSRNANRYITRLSNGFFRVMIPFRNEFSGLTLYAYYFKEDGTKEEYKIYFTDNYIYFDTKHFSVYSIGYSTGNSSSVSIEKPNVTISKGNNNSLVLNWDNKSASKYIIYRSTNGKKWSKLTEVKDTNYTNSKLTYGKTYYYRIKACNDNGCSNYSNVVKKKVVPDKVDNLRVISAGTKNIKISWDKVSVSGYEVYMGKSRVATIKKSGTLKFNKTKLKANKSYTFKVRAYKVVNGKKVYGAFSDVITAKTAPSSPKVSVGLKDYNSLNINVKGVGGATKYEIVRSTSKKGTYTKVGELTTAGTYVDENLNTGSTYYYKVRSCNDNDCGSYSGIVSKKVIPLTPTISVVSPEIQKVVITASKVNGVNGYEVYRSNNSKKGYKKVGEITDLENFTFENGTSKGKTYYYKVRAYTLVNGKKVYSSYSKIKKIKSL